MEQPYHYTLPCVSIAGKKCHRATSNPRVVRKTDMKGHYCRICGEYKANERFSGKGHTQHICKECAKLPVDKRNEALLITRIESLPFRLSKEQRAWLEKMRKDDREEIRSAAEWAYEMRFPHTLSP